MMDSMTCMGAPKVTVSWPNKLLWKWNGHACYITCNCILSSICTSDPCWWASESWLLWTVSLRLSCLLPPNGTWPMGAATGDQSIEGRKVRMAVVPIFVLLPPTVVAMTTPLHDYTSPWEPLIDISSSQWDPALTVTSSCSKAQGWLRSPSLPVMSPFSG